MRTDIKSFLDLKKNGHLLLISIAAILVGVLVGIIDMIFGAVLNVLTAFRQMHFLYLIPFLPLSGLLIVFLYDRFGGKSIKGMGLVFDVADKKEVTIPKRLVPLAIFSTWLTHLFGASAGREGVAVQIGAALSHAFSPIFKFEESSRSFLIIGIAAGFAGLFQTPMAAILFALEVLVIGRLELSTLLPTSLAAYTASYTSHLLGLKKFTHLIRVTIELNPVLFLKLAFLGVLFGLVGTLFAYLLRRTKLALILRFRRPYQRIVLVGLLLSVLLTVLGMGRYSGLSTGLLINSFKGNVFVFDWLFKLILTVLTLSAGYQGGEVMPMFTIGAALGAVLAPFFNLPAAFVAALGYASVFGSGTSTFLAPVFIGGEIFGFENIPYFFIVVCFASIVKKQISVYSSQKVING
ncbi:chloride channel protein [Streptococcus macacae]|uniref:Chloride transporter, ClC family n=1 Tax=Streptococcus macacae NCTC 11558 TaxID=764298 RepID=G5JYV5_9STRE|nr:chloride channel protein [Streptococcus macacae]EHJ53343.1 chloride transporter, ClC family [Streptococcus macacae NCTC 11558]SUN78212.1 putative permease chloride channel [Streptococcus macacae NCTC 11558]